MAQSVFFYSRGASLFIDVEESLRASCEKKENCMTFTQDISSHRAHGNVAKLRQLKKIDLDVIVTLYAKEKKYLFELNLFNYKANS